MEGKKKVVNVALVQNYLDARSKAEMALSEMNAATKKAEAAQDEIADCSALMLEDPEILKILETTGIRTLDGSIVIADEDCNVLVKPHVNVPSIWELKGND